MLQLRMLLRLIRMDAQLVHLVKLVKRGEHLMSALSDALATFAADQANFNGKLDVALTNIAADIAGLNDLITKLQASSGEVTPADQALIDQLETQGAALAAKADALDQLTPPVVPTP